MNKKPQISQVKDNKQKQQNYQKLMVNYKVAIEHKYYAEAELIVYAFLEDRLRSIIYYLGATNAWNKQWLTDEAASITGQVSNLNDMSTKTDILLKLFKAAQRDSCSSYIENIKNKFSKSEIKELVATLKNIDEWRGFRNEIVHSLFNKDLEELEQKFQEHVENGFSYGRLIENTIDKLKRK